MCVTRIRETKDSTKLLHGEIADIANFELGGLAHDPRREGTDEQARERAATRGDGQDAPGCPSLVLRPRSFPR